MLLLLLLLNSWLHLSLAWQMFDWSVAQPQHVGVNFQSCSSVKVCSKRLDDISMYFNFLFQIYANWMNLIVNIVLPLAVLVCENFNALL